MQSTNLDELARIDPLLERCAHVVGRERHVLVVALDVLLDGGIRGAIALFQRRNCLLDHLVVRHADFTVGSSKNTNMSKGGGAGWTEEVSMPSATICKVQAQEPLRSFSALITSLTISQCVMVTLLSDI